MIGENSNDGMSEACRTLQTPVNRRKRSMLTSVVVKLYIANPLLGWRTGA